MNTVKVHVKILGSTTARTKWCTARARGEATSIYIVSQAMAWILVVGHALNLVLNTVSATSVYSLGIMAL
jgi:hypothetical protein